MPERTVCFGGQAQIIFKLKLSMFRGVIPNQLDGFPMGQAMFQYIDPDILQPRLIHKAGIGGITSF